MNDLYPLVTLSNMPTIRKEKPKNKEISDVLSNEDMSIFLGNIKSIQREYYKALDNKYPWIFTDGACEGLYHLIQKPFSSVLKAPPEVRLLSFLKPLGFSVSLSSNHKGWTVYSYMRLSRKKKVCSVSFIQEETGETRSFRNDGGGFSGDWVRSKV